MWKRAFAIAALAAFGWIAGPTWAADTPDTAAQEPIYGSQLMTPQERSEYRRKMQQATTAAERERIRQSHHEAMQARARERGMTLPQEPPGRLMGPGPGTGMGMGGGMGGMGRGTGPGMNGGMPPQNGTGPRGTTP